MDRCLPRTLSIIPLILVATGCVPAPTDFPPPSPSPSSTPAPTASACASGGSATLEVETESVEAITRFLNGGGDPSVLASSLYELGWAASGSAFVDADLNRDGAHEIAVGLAGPPGGIYLWRCRDGSYVPIQILAGREPPFGPPALESAVDLTGDSLPELVAFHPLCGAHTCFAQYTVLQWDEDRVVDLLRGQTDDLPSPEWSAHPASPGEPSRLSITAMGIGSVGAGPYRRTTRTWNWDETQSVFLPTGDTFEAPRFRIHALHDADAALEAGDLEQSLELYQAIIADDDLLDWPAAGDGRSALAAYAAYRSILTHLAAGSPEEARAQFEAALAETDEAAAPYAALADLLLARFPEAGLEAACAAVRQRVEEDPALYLAPLDFGYANRQYAVADICRLPPSG